MSQPQPIIVLHHLHVYFLNNWNIDEGNYTTNKMITTHKMSSSFAPAATYPLRAFLAHKASILRTLDIFWGPVAHACIYLYLAPTFQYLFFFLKNSIII